MFKTYLCGCTYTGYGIFTPYKNKPRTSIWISLSLDIWVQKLEKFSTHYIKLFLKTGVYSQLLFLSYLLWKHHKHSGIINISKSIMSVSVFGTIYFVRRKFFNSCVLSQCIVNWIHLQNIHIVTYQKALVHTLFCLFLEPLKAVIFNETQK